MIINYKKLVITNHDYKNTKELIFSNNLLITNLKLSVCSAK